MKSIFLLILAASTAFGAEGVLIKNGGFEEGLDEWVSFTQVRPSGEISVDGSEAHSGSSSALFRFLSDPADYQYLGIRQQLTGLTPGGKYVLSFWGKGQISGVRPKFGASDDEIGNINYAYAEVENSVDWVKYEVIFTADNEGKKYINFIITDRMDDYRIDDLAVEPAN